MSYLKVNNPSDKDVTNIYLGDTYFVKAGGSEKVSTAVAHHLINIYPFLTAGEVEVVKEVKEVKEVKVIKEAKKEVKGK